VARHDPRRDDVVGLEATIIMHPKIWEASGHTTTFADPMVDCLLTKKRFRADQIDPQSGIAYHYSGAEDGQSKSKTSTEPIRSCSRRKNPESARKVARQFYQQRGLGRTPPCWANAPRKSKTPPATIRKTAAC
jgi:glycyl-tRNA synthetase